LLALPLKSVIFFPFFFFLYCSPDLGAVPLEPRNELRQAYCRIFTQTPAQRVETIVHPDDVNALFRQMGARPEALDLTDMVVEDTYEQTSQKTQVKDRGILFSIFDLLRNAADLFSDDTRERAIHILMRMTLDTSLTSNNLVHSELQSTLSALLESVPAADTVEMVRTLPRSK
jgi:hypothetical protein